ncbi:unnamed protein product [Ectocarpus sp. 8 AP-2014]
MVVAKRNTFGSVSTPHAARQNKTQVLGISLPYVLSVGGEICSSLGLLVVCSDELVHFFLSCVGLD